MWIKVVNDGLSNNYETKSKKIGTLFIGIGTLTAIYTLFSPFYVSIILGTVLTFVGLVSSYLTAKMNMKIPASWTKSLLLFLIGMVFLFGNIVTDTTVAILIGLFFLIGSINDLYLAYITKKDATVYAWLINALLSIVFAYIVLAHRETIPSDALGLLVSLRLIVNGISVIFSGRMIYVRP